MRYNYGDPLLGACKQSLLGGNHFRYWQQAPSQAYFLAASFEMNLTLNHNIERPDGYDHGRDSIVANATRFGGARSPLSSMVYDTKVRMVQGEGYLAVNSSSGVNHGLIVDGKVAILTVSIQPGTISTTGATAAPPASTGSVSRSIARSSRRIAWSIFLCARNRKLILVELQAEESNDGNAVECWTDSGSIVNFMIELCIHRQFKSHFAFRPFDSQLVVPLSFNYRNENDGEMRSIHMFAHETDKGDFANI